MSDAQPPPGQWLIHQMSHWSSRSAHFYVGGVLPTAACGFTDNMAKFGPEIGHPELVAMYREPAQGTPRCKRCTKALDRVA